jgi:hypothetical protein
MTDEGDESLASLGVLSAVLRPTITNFENEAVWTRQPYAYTSLYGVSVGIWVARHFDKHHA